MTGLPTEGQENNSQPQSPGDGEASPRRSPETPADINIAMRCALKGNVQRFIKCFEDEEDTFRDTVQDMINERDGAGKSPLDMAAALGRAEMIKELISRGGEVNSVTPRGYTALHRAAAWGKIECLKVLVDGGANLQLKTTHGERARETALRYNQSECVDYLEWAEARQNLIDAITNIRETIADPEKVQGRLTRDDKNASTAVCNEKQEWLDGATDATTQDFILQNQELDEALSPVWLKLSEPPPEKGERK